MLTEQQANTIKEQLLKQLDNFPENQQEIVKKKILSMTVQEVEEFVKQNQLSHLEQKKEAPTTECIFCNIASKQIPSSILEEDKDNLAVLEINPLSKGHSMVIPKKHVETQQIPASTFRIAKQIAKQIKKKFKPAEIKITAQKIIGHSLIEVLPLYGDEKERKKASEEELKEIQEILRIKEKVKRVRKIKKEKTENSKIPILKPRIP